MATDNQEPDPKVSGFPSAGRTVSRGAFFGGIGLGAVIGIGGLTGVDRLALSPGALLAAEMIVVALAMFVTVYML